jgi:hypothetical protein
MGASMSGAGRHWACEGSVTEENREGDRGRFFEALVLRQRC